MAAEIIFIRSRTVSEELIYDEAMAAYDAHRTVRTDASLEKAARLLRMARALQAKEPSGSGARTSSCAEPAS